MKQAVVTGGRGFIGTNLCMSLLEDGYRVLALDDLSCTDNKHLIAVGYDFRQMDVRHQDALFSSVLQWRHREFPVEFYHLACPASPINYAMDPLRTLETCVDGTKSVLTVAAHTPNSRVLFTSTSEIYGEPEISPQPETYRGNVNTWGPRACYDEGKRAAETLCWIFQETKELDVRVVRLFNTYGPYMAWDDGRVVSNFITQSLEERAHTLYGTGKQSRSFCYVSDTVRAIRLVMSLRKGEITEPINIGNPEEITIAQISEQIRGMLRSKEGVVYAPLPKDDPTQRCPDITKIRSFGWKPEVDLVTGLENTIEYFKEKIEQGEALI